MKKFALIIFFLAVSLLAGDVKHTILLIGNGLGKGSFDAYCRANPQSALSSLKQQIVVKNADKNGHPTDSAAAATALACGVKTTPGMVGLNSDGEAVQSLAKIVLQEKGRVAIVAGGSINDPLPGAHAANRKAKEKVGIASDFNIYRISFLGSSTLNLSKDEQRHFFQQQLGRNGFAVSQNGKLTNCLKSKKKINVDDENIGKLNLALFNVKNTNSISLKEYTQIAIKALPDNQKSLLVATSADLGQAKNLADFDKAVAVALEYQKAHQDDTLVVVTFDRNNLNPAEDVIACVVGKDCETFGKTIENNEIPVKIASAMNLDAKKLGNGSFVLPSSQKGGCEDYFVARSATHNSLMFQYGLVNLTGVPVKVALTDANGQNIANDACNDLYGRFTFNNLKPATEYTLTMTAADGKTFTAKGKTLTEPKGKKLFSVVVLSDLHFSLYGDIPYGRMMTYGPEALMNIINFCNDNNIPFILDPGDFSDSSEPMQFETLRKISTKFKGKFLNTPGNHDRYNAKNNYESVFGKGGNAGAGIVVYKGVQFVWLATGGTPNAKTGLLNKPQNIKVMEQLDINKPTVIFSHYQLKKESNKYAKLTDKDSVIHDSDDEESQKILNKIASIKCGVIYIGHKNVAMLNIIGKLQQLNAPQTTQFPCGCLLVDFYTDGIMQRFKPTLTPRQEEISRRLSGVKSARKRDTYSFELWNQFIPMAIK